VLLEEIFQADRSQSSKLFPVLERVRKRIERLDIIAVGLGPGSYAGTRIAIAAALGFACATGAELVGLPSVAALQTEAHRYIAIGDARRDTFYFTCVEDGTCVEGPLLLELADLEAQLSQYPDAVVLAPTPLPQIPRAQVALPTASRIAVLAAQGRSIVKRGDLEPLYLREPHITTAKARPSFEGPR
jgi:tRNA threonylcarbamoyladenosine biosynthesis protein TsaB